MDVELHYSSFPFPLVKNWGVLRLVAWLQSPKDPLEVAASLLSAVKTVRGEPGSLQLAIPWPDSEPDTTGDPEGGDSGEPVKPCFIQVDLHQTYLLWQTS